MFSKVKNSSCSFTTDQTGESFLTKPEKLSKIVAKAVIKLTGQNNKLEMATDGGTSDARFIKDYCEVLELGLINRTLHQVDEYVLVDDLKKLTDLYFLILEIYFDKVQ